MLCIIGGCPILPVYAGELQARSLGASIKAYNEEGMEIVDKIGELVITKPMPSMPLYFGMIKTIKDTKKVILICIPAFGAMVTF